MRDDFAGWLGLRPAGLRPVNLQVGLFEAHASHQLQMAESRFALQEHQRRILNERAEFLQELRPYGTVNDTMIAA